MYVCGQNPRFLTRHTWNHYDSGQISNFSLHLFDSTDYLVCLVSGSNLGSEFGKVISQRAVPTMTTPQEA